MFGLIVLIFTPVLLAVAALLWGADSREGIDSPEWERRRDWPGFHPDDVGRRRVSYGRNSRSAPSRRASDRLDLGQVGSASRG